MRQENYINYEVIESTRRTYLEQVRTLESLDLTMDRANNLLVNDGMRNETSVAFKERYEEVHRRALKDLTMAIDDLARYLQQYVANRQEEDSAGAAGLRVR